jgi:hypothetical protein
MRGAAMGVADAEPSSPVSGRGSSQSFVLGEERSSIVIRVDRTSAINTLLRLRSRRQLSDFEELLPAQCNYLPDPHHRHHAANPRRTEPLLPVDALLSSVSGRHLNLALLSASLPPSSTMHVHSTTFRGTCGADLCGLSNSSRCHGNSQLAVL